jgi:hypothetical protein
MNAVIRIWLRGALAEIDGAIAAAAHDRELSRSLWRARAEIVRAKVVAERELIEPIDKLDKNGDVRDLGGVV